MRLFYAGSKYYCLSKISGLYNSTGKDKLRLGNNQNKFLLLKINRLF